jgi:DivIVA domain-containing protein
MPLDRHDIEKRDFPIGRRGYEPEAVDAHLARLADEIERLQLAAQVRPAGSVADAASAQVRAIVEAAEQSAAAIERDAEAEAERIRTEAQREAERKDQEAVERSREHVAKVGEQTAQMLQRVEAMEKELSTLLDAVRTSANRLKADLALLETNMEQLYAAAGAQRGELGGVAAGGDALARARAGAVVETAGGGEPAAEAGDATAPAGEAASDGTGANGAQAAAVAELGAEAPAGAAEADAPDGGPAPEDGAVDGAGAAPAEGADVEGARLVALNMALEGRPREETDRYLAENFDLPDRQALLDEVYATVGG